MRPLPALAAGPGNWVLPISDRSAEALVELLLTADPAEAVSLAAETLAADPPLALWCGCRAGGGLLPQSLEDLARWLYEHALEVLPAAEGQPADFDQRQLARSERYANMVAESLQVASLAAMLAEADGRPAAEKAYLAGLVANAADWIVASGHRRPRSASRRSSPAPPPGMAAGANQAASATPPGVAAGANETGANQAAPATPPGVTSVSPRGVAAASVSPGGHAGFPAWFAAEGPAAKRVGEAIAYLAGTSPAGEWEADVEGCRQQALQGRRRWLESVPGPGRRLPDLLTRLARLDQLERRFQQTLEREKLSAMAEFAAGAGHEINNPLAIIAGRAQLCLREETDPQRRRELALINAQVKRAYEMIADMRLFARPPRPELKTVELASFLDSLVVELAAAATEQGTSLAWSGEKGPLEIEADPVQIHVAVGALVKNALEALAGDGHVGIELCRRDDGVGIVVCDDGPGILPEHRPHIFDPFYSSRQAGRGLGLGLSKCWRIVGLHHGRLEVQSEPGQGARFTIVLPLRQPQA
jgi:signal transduction histidine kinase